MTLQARLWALEEKLWTAGAEYYREQLADPCEMVFPDPIGALTREEVITAVSTQDRWSRVRMDDRRCVPLTDTVLLLLYRARAQRGGERSTYGARAASVYVNRAGAWQLAFHQQTPHLAEGASSKERLSA